ncbi:MAG TPA: hypothetical protein DEB09_02645 [Candidatus Magasanikbacteria bacterium]|nr:hypothetical protein [Candidatus Magasanikbacteria bacterium]
MDKKIYLTLATVTILLIGAGCNQATPQPKININTQNTIPTNKVTPPATDNTINTKVENKTIPNTKTFTVKANNYKFDQTNIIVNQGDEVEIVFVNQEGFHDFVLDEFNARTKQLTANNSETIKFIADKVGTFEYYCSVGKHRQMGMVGKLIVE